MEGLVFERGARFIVGAPHPTVTTEGFAQGVLRQAGVRRALSSRARLLHVSPVYELDKEADRDYCRECEAIFYDYGRNRAVRVRGVPGGRGPFEVRETVEQPLPSGEEFAEAVKLVAASPVWGPLLRAGSVGPYKPMPPMLESPDGQPVERTLYVGLMSKPRRFNQIVAVNMLRGEVSRAGVKPVSSLADGTICGVAERPCRRSPRGLAGSVTIEWPTEDPVWRFHAIRPANSSGTNGSGIELRDVRYRGVRVLKQAHVPILNVEYDQDLCGPFRDWLWEETCFEAVGTDIPGAPGFRACTEAPRTVFESGADGGGFVGVAVYETPEGALQLVTQMSAGWYRYITEWRFHRDGTILPRFRFGGTNNSCVCNAHNHHAYWRFDFDVVDAKNTVEQQVNGVWTHFKKETSVRRQVGEELRWRVVHPKTQAGYEIISGPLDDVGDAFSGDDQYVLKFNNREIDDGHSLVSFQAPADLKKFVRKQSVTKKDVVVWYAAHFRHTVSEEGAFHEHEEELGPTLRPFNWPPAGRK